MPVSNFVQWEASVRGATLHQHAGYKRLVREAMPYAQRAVRDSIRNRIPPGATISSGMPNVFPGYAATGRMKETIVASPIVDRGNSWVARVGLARQSKVIDIIKALVHENGKVIVPRKAKALRFVINGQVIFAQRVYIRPKKFFASGWAEAPDVFRRAMLVRMEELYRKSSNPSVQYGR